MTSLIDFQKNKKTYIVVVIGIVLGAYQAYTGHDLPSYVNWGLMFLGLGTTRMAITNQSKTAAMDIMALVNNVLSTVTVTNTETTTPAPTTVATGDIVKVNEQKIVIGQPSPASQTEESITAALNKAQVTDK